MDASNDPRFVTKAQRRSSIAQHPNNILPSSTNSARGSRSCLPSVRPHRPSCAANEKKTHTPTHKDQVSVSGSHIFVRLVCGGVTERFNSPAGGSVGAGRCECNCCSKARRVREQPEFSRLEPPLRHPPLKGHCHAKVCVSGGRCLSSFNWKSLSYTYIYKILRLFG